MAAGIVMKQELFFFSLAQMAKVDEVVKLMFTSLIAVI